MGNVATVEAPAPELSNTAKRMLEIDAMADSIETVEALNMDASVDTPESALTNRPPREDEPYIYHRTPGKITMWKMLPNGKWSPRIVPRKNARILLKEGGWTVENPGPQGVEPFSNCDVCGKKIFDNYVSNPRKDEGGIDLGLKTVAEDSTKRIAIVMLNHVKDKHPDRPDLATALQKIVSK